MVQCWGIEFKNVQELWEHPRCYVRTMESLKKRLTKLPPEEAVIAPFYSYRGKTYKSIYLLHQACGEHLSRTELYRRLGFIYNGQKIVPEMAIHQWGSIKHLPRSGVFETLF